MARQIWLNSSIAESQSAVVESVYKLAHQVNELVIYGPTECAKTFECIKLAHALCTRHNNFQCCVVRKAKTTIYSTVFQTLKQHILPYGVREVPQNLIKVHGGQNTPLWLDYKDTGARMWFLGEDDKTGKALGTEWDLGFYSQCEKASPLFWKEFSGRCTGRAKNWKVNGNFHGLLLGECNPGPSRHFLRVRESEGINEMVKFQHVDSPMIFYNNQYTPYGQKTIERLKRTYGTSGVDYERLYLGNWVSAEGIVYKQYDPNIHDVEETQILSEIEDDWIWSASCDHGHTHPFVFHLYCGPADRSRLYLFKEIFHSQLDIDAMTKRVDDLLEEYLPSGKRLLWTVADHRPEINKTIEKLGIIVTNAEKEKLPGIATVRRCLLQKKIFFNKNSLVHNEDIILRGQGDPTRTTHEFERYSYRPPEKMDGSEKDDVPIGKYNDGLDTLRYELVKWAEPKLPYVSLATTVPLKQPKSFF